MTLITHRIPCFALMEAYDDFGTHERLVAYHATQDSAMTALNNIAHNGGAYIGTIGPDQDAIEDHLQYETGVPVMFVRPVTLEIIDLNRESGLHASLDPFDALAYAPEPRFVVAPCEPINTTKENT